VGETFFPERRESVTDEGRSRRPATSRTEENIAIIRHIERENRQLTQEHSRASERRRRNSKENLN
jgi:hypothetical protein